MKKLLFAALAITLLLCACSPADNTDGLVVYENIDALADALGYFPNTPQHISGTGYTETYGIVDGDIVQIVYKNSSNTITYRTKKVADESICGIDVAQFDESENNRSKGFDVPILGTGGKLYLAEWSEDQKSFSVYFEKGAAAEEFDEIIKGI